MPPEIETQPSPPRYPLVDFLRGLAVFLMIIYHFSYDLNYFNLTNINLFDNPFWWFLPRFIVFLFLLCSGIGLSLTHKQGVRWKKFRERFLLVAGSAALISVVTYLLFPQNWIYFGTLHSVATSSLLCLPFVKRPKTALLVALLLLAGPLIPWPDVLPHHKSLDYIPLVPWMGVVLLGIFLEDRSFHQLPLPGGRYLKYFTWPGRHSLAIYLVHQPVLFGLCYILSWLLMAP